MVKQKTVVKCARCRNIHKFDDRIWRQLKTEIGEVNTCTRCGGSTYILIYDSDGVECKEFKHLTERSQKIATDLLKD